MYELSDVFLGGTYLLRPFYLHLPHSCPVPRENRSGVPLTRAHFIRDRVGQSRKIAVWLVEESLLNNAKQASMSGDGKRLRTATSRPPHPSDGLSADATPRKRRTLADGAIRRARSHYE